MLNMNHDRNDELAVPVAVSQPGYSRRYLQLVKTEPVYSRRYLALTGRSLANHPDQR
jgi:hypothetical protein